VFVGSGEREREEVVERELVDCAVVHDALGDSSKKWGNVDSEANQKTMSRPGICCGIRRFRRSRYQFGHCELCLQVAIWDRLSHHLKFCHFTVVGTS
jgi:hypothetical protein